MNIETILTKSLKMLYDSLYMMVLSLMLTQLVLLLTFGGGAGLVALFMSLHLLLMITSMRLAVFKEITIKISNHTVIMLIAIIITAMFNAVPVKPVISVVENIYNDYMTENEDYETVDDFVRDMYAFDNPSKLNKITQIAKEYATLRYDDKTIDIEDREELNKLRKEEREIHSELDIISNGLSKYVVLYYCISYFICMLGNGVCLLVNEKTIYKNNISMSRRVDT